jgi:hypothetical protein
VAGKPGAAVEVEGDGVGEADVEGDGDALGEGDADGLAEGEGLGDGFGEWDGLGDGECFGLGDGVGLSGGYQYEQESLWDSWLSTSALPQSALPPRPDVTGATSGPVSTRPPTAPSWSIT